MFNKAEAANKLNQKCLFAKDFQQNFSWSMNGENGSLTNFTGMFFRDFNFDNMLVILEL